MQQRFVSVLEAAGLYVFEHEWRECFGRIRQALAFSRWIPARMKLGCLSVRTQLLIIAGVSSVGAVDAWAADPVAAEALFQQGKQLVGEKKYAEACPKYDASYKLDPTLGTLLNLADCLEKEGRIATAWSTWGAAMEQAQRDKDSRSEYAAERRQALVPKLPKVVIRASNMVAGVTVFWDNVELAPAALGVEMPTDSAEHMLVVRRDDGAILHEQRVRIAAEGKKTEIPLDIAALDRDKPRLAGWSGAGKSQRNAGIVIGSVGAAALVTAGGLTLAAMLGRDQANETGACVDKFCTPAGIESIQSARTFSEAGQWIGLGGIIAFSVGATLFFAAPSTAGTAPKVAASRRPSETVAIVPIPSRVWVSPWAGPTGGGVVFGGVL